jgi:hypothetical protein
MIGRSDRRTADSWRVVVDTDDLSGFEILPVSNGGIIYTI